MQLRFFPIAAAFLVSNAFAQRTVSIAVPGQSKSIQADLYGSGNRALILAHGGRFDRASWRKQAPLFAQAGFLVLAVSFRGDTFNQDGSPSALGSNADNATDVLAAVAYLQQTGAKTISAIGASLGGDAIGEADSRSQPGVFDRLVFLGSDGGATPEKSSGRKLFIIARDDKRGGGDLRLPGISAHYALAPQPKKLILLDGSAHAQFLFDTEQGPALMKALLAFLSEP